MSELEFGETPFPLDAVHDLDLLRVSRDGTAEPAHPRRRLVRVPRYQQGIESKGGVPEPGVAIVPVPVAADGLGERGRRRGTDGTGGVEGEGLQGDERAHDQV